MYEYLLSWSLESLRSGMLSGGKQEHAILLEAIKAKNGLVLERFRVAESACAELVGLTIRIETELAEFQAQYSEGGPKDSKSYMGDLGRQLHPRFYREFRKIRTRFDVTNDLLSGYSIGLVDWIQFRNIEAICRDLKFTSPSHISRIYRLGWTFLSSTITRLLRISTNDLRFWLTDKPYTRVALRWAKERELATLRTFFLLHLDKSKTFFPALESPEGLELFWKEVEDGKAVALDSLSFFMEAAISKQLIEEPE